MSQSGEVDAEILAVIQEAGLEPGPEADVPVLDAASIAAGVFGADRRVLALSPALAALGGLEGLDEAAFERVARGGPPELSHAEIRPAGAAAELALVALGRAGSALGWRLPPDIRLAAERHPGAVVVLTAHAAAAEGPLAGACRAFGLTPLEERVAMAAMLTGNIRTASARAGVAYDTGREALAKAFARVGVNRLPAFVARLASHVFGVLPDGEPGPALADLWGLTGRQAAVAALVGQGASRAQAGRALGVSEAVARKELELVFDLLQTPSAAALSRKIVEAQALRWILGGTEGEVGFLDPAAEPLLYVPRPAGGRIAVSDYGPPGGRPLLVVHSSMTSRVVARRLLRALHEAGYRPIAIDRPGYGLSDPWPGMRAGEHDPFDTAARDALAVLDRLKLARADLMARGGAQVVAALQRMAPGRLGAVALVNPDPPTTAAAPISGAYGVVKAAYARNPACIRLNVNLLTRGLTLERTERMMRRWMAGSRPDEQASADPELVRDYFRALRMFALGKTEGYVNEQVELVRAPPLAPLEGVGHWQILVAANDTLHNPDHVMAYWGPRLPGATFHRIADGGRLLALTRPELVVRALAESSVQRRR